MKFGNERPVLIAVGSIEEYRVVDGPEVRAKGKKPSSPWSYTARGLAAFGSERRGHAILPDTDPVHEYHKGLFQIWEELGVVTNVSPVWVDDPLINNRDSLDHVLVQDTERLAVQLRREK